jgi:hypothetical protein
LLAAAAAGVALITLLPLPVQQRQSTSALVLRWERSHPGACSCQ